MTTVTHLDIPFVRREEKDTHYNKLHVTICVVDGQKFAGGVNFSLRIFEKLFTDINLSHSMRFHTCELELEISQRTV